MGRTPDPKVLGQGFATIVVVLVGRRLAKPAARAFRSGRKTLKAIPNYAEYLREETVRRGVREGSAPWLGLAVVVWGTRYMRKRRRQSSIVLREVLQPGERVFITQVPRKKARAS